MMNEKNESSIPSETYDVSIKEPDDSNEKVTIEVDKKTIKEAQKLIIESDRVIERAKRLFLL